MGLSQIPRFLGLRAKAKVGTRTSYGVTTLGKQKSDAQALSGPYFTVLSHLAEDGPSSVHEITRECNLNEDKVRAILRGLMRDGYVQPATGE